MFFLSSRWKWQKYLSSRCLIPSKVFFFRTDVELHHVPNDVVSFGWEVQLFGMGGVCRGEGSTPGQGGVQIGMGRVCTEVGDGCR